LLNFAKLGHIEYHNVRPILATKRETYYALICAARPLRAFCVSRKKTKYQQKMALRCMKGNHMPHTLYSRERDDSVAMEELPHSSLVPFIQLIANNCGHN
jgi:hypothetical protein